MNRLRAVAAPAMALALAACTVGPNYAPPKAPTPAAWGPEPADVASRISDGAVDLAWWTRFGDPELTSLVERLAHQNLDLQAAAERIEQARAQRTVVRSQGLPHIEGQGFAEEMRPSQEGILKTFTPSKEAHDEFQLYQATAQASWELDLFGRIRRATEAAGANAQAMVEARRAVALSATAELCQDYLQLRGLQAREATRLANLEDARQRVALVRDRIANGTAADLDLAQAQAQADGVSQELPTLRQGEARLSNAIGLLLAQPPRALEGELKSPGALPGRPPLVPVGLPSDLLRRRPDVREAEARLHAATAQVGVAVADFFPQVSLTGDLGVQSLSTSNLFNWSSRTFMGGPSLSIPVFEGGRLKGTLDLRKAEQREAALAYRRTVLQALRDVDDALTAYTETQHRRDDMAATLKSDETALSVAEKRYAQGTADSLNVISAQSDVLRSREALVQMDAELDTDIVTLFRALGGGWNSD